ncbi:MAG: LytTR family transcriptional regulator DNA-binding domain-containing protein [Bacteroidales bacterium]|jgi:DNA-binding MarR family transcriptional regulator|nr:LytTR family transcriptional regulator DNA-binding domain-containing protein [Bacteroidales bacterium]
MQQNKKKSILIIIAHILFWLGICYFFSHYSYLRPVAFGAIYKELLCVLFIVIMVYFNYFYLIPKFFQKGKLIIYLLLAILTVLLASLGEYFLLKPHISWFYANSFTPDEINGALRTAFGLIYMRDLCFLMFFFTLRLYNELFNKIIREKLSLAKEIHHISIVSPKSGSIYTVMLDDIIYISQKGNYSTFHLSNGNTREQYSSLTNIERTFPDNTCLRINKNNLVITLHILSYDESSVVMNLKVKGRNITLDISPKYLENILERLNKVFNSKPIAGKETKRKLAKIGGVTTPTKDENDDKRGINDGVTQIKNDLKTTDYTINIKKSNEETQDIIENIELSQSSKLILMFIKNYYKNPENTNKSCRVPAIGKGVNLAERTVETHIKILKENNLIEYKGASRNGGYFVVEKNYSM